MNKIFKIFYKNPYFPNHNENLMEDEGNVIKARNNFLKTRFQNLEFLLFNRYDWMNNYLKKNDEIYEIGAGAGFSELYLSPKPILTDAIIYPWIDKKIDAMKLPFKDNSVDVIIASHTIHHFYSPISFLKECNNALRPGGKIIIQEINTSLIMRFFLKLMKHEGWSYQVNIFDDQEIANNPSDLWSANCAIPELLFYDNKKFEKAVPFFKIIKNELNECFLFPISGGVISKTRVPNIPIIILKLIKVLDKCLIFIAPNIFAMGRSVVLEKR